MLGERQGFVTITVTMQYQITCSRTLQEIIIAIGLERERCDEKLLAVSPKANRDTAIAVTSSNVLTVFFQERERERETLILKGTL